MIFDFDGVISDTDEGRFKLLASILSEYNIDLSSTNNPKELAGITTDSFLAKNFKNLSTSDINNIIQRRREIYLANLKDFCVPIKGSIENIKKYSRITHLYLATTNDCDVTYKLLNHLLIKDYFKEIFCRDDVEIENSTLKNYPDILRRINITPEKCVVVEDSEIGVVSASKARAVTVKFGTQNISANIHIDYSVENHQDLDKLLRKILEV